MLRLERRCLSLLIISLVYANRSFNEILMPPCEIKFAISSLLIPSARDRSF